MKIAIAIAAAILIGTTSAAAKCQLAGGTQDALNAGMVWKEP